MSRRTRSFSILLIIVAIAVGWATYHPQAEEIGPEEPSPVSEPEIQIYLNVYKAMQSDHGLTIEDALQPQKISLEEFRHIERRIQEQPRLVERVRDALTEHAKSHSAF